MIIRTSVSFQTWVCQAATQKANRLFGGNLSAYLTYLICKDYESEQKENTSVDAEEDISERV